MKHFYPLETFNQASQSGNFKIKHAYLEHFVYDGMLLIQTQKSKKSGEIENVFNKKHCLNRNACGNKLRICGRSSCSW